MKLFLRLITLLALFCLVSACAPSLSSGVYQGGQVGVASQTVTGTVVSKRLVQINQNSGIGTLVGVGTGAVAGSAIGGGSRAPILTGIGGALAGGLLGNVLEGKVNSQQGYEYLIRVEKSKVISVTQTLDTNLSIGQSVTVIYGDPVRVIPN